VQEQTQVELGHLPASLCTHLSVASLCYFSLAAPAMISLELVEVCGGAQVSFSDGGWGPVLLQELRVGCMWEKGPPVKLATRKVLRNT